MSLIPIVRAAAGALLCCATLCCQPPDEARRAAETWLIKDCGEGDRQKIEAQLERYKTEIEPTFVRALREGPTSQQIAAEQEEAARRFQRLQQTIKRGKELGLSESDLALW